MPSEHTKSVLSGLGKPGLTFKKREILQYRQKGRSHDISTGLSQDLKATIQECLPTNAEQSKGKAVHMMFPQTYYWIYTPQEGKSYPIHA